MSTSAGPNNVTSGLVLDVDMSNTSKSWLGAPATNLAVTVPYTSTVYAYCSGPVATASVMDANNQPRTVNRYTITQASGLTPRARIVATGLSAGVNYSYSCKIKYNGPTAATALAWYIDSSKGNPEGTGNNTFTTHATTATAIGNGWYQLTETFNFATCPTGGAWSNFGFAAPDATFLSQTFDAYDIQFEQNAVATPYVNGTRSSTQAIVDLTGNNVVTTTNLVPNANGTFDFNGTSSVINAGITISPSVFTISCWVYKTGTAVSQGIVRKQYAYAISLYNGTVQVAPGNAWAFNNSGITIDLNVWTNIVWSHDGTTSVLYKNGVNAWSYTNVGTMPANTWPTNIGYDENNWWWSGQIASTQIYNRALTASEVAQNFNALRGRYGI
jgi:hypothetical protein